MYRDMPMLAEGTRGGGGGGGTVFSSVMNVTSVIWGGGLCFSEMNVTYLKIGKFGRTNYS